MAGSFIGTGTYSNLTRQELEQLRRADFTAGGKALTVGDSALGAENVVGKGDVNAEPFFTGPPVNLDDVYPITPPSQPGPGLLTKAGTGNLISEFARWWGPTLIWDSAGTGYATAAASWVDLDIPSSFPVLGVLPGDILLIKPTNGTTDQNTNTAATILAVGATSLSLSNIWNPDLGATGLDFTSGSKFNYLIVRPKALPLFAVPGSGPLGQEQTFLTVLPGAPIHNQLAPTLAQINAQRIQDVVRPNAGLNPSVDRADFVYNFGTARSIIAASLLTLGYRVVLYPDDGTGTGPNLSTPITTFSPIIDPAIPAADQRMTFDYKAGVVRFSCAPKLGGNIKVAGGVNATTGRLNVYAVFWAIDLTLTRGHARGLYAPRSSDSESFTAGRLRFDNAPAMATTLKGFRMGASPIGSDAYVKALDAPEGQISNATTYPFVAPWDRASVEIGAIEANSLGLMGLRYFSYRQTEHQWRFSSTLSAFYAEFGYESEMFVADKTAFTVSDAGGPAQAAANMNPVTTFGGSNFGVRSHIEAGLMTDLHRQLATTPYGTVHLKKGRYYVQKSIHVPPGTTIEGEGAGTKLIFRNFDTTTTSFGSERARSVFKIGPNTKWGVYDASAYPDDLVTFYKTHIEPTSFNLPVPTRVEGADTVWNPVRRCWGTVFADATANAVYFNEVLEDGSRRFPGLGLNVKDNATNLFTVNSPGGSHHTGGHYPRLAYQEHSDEYSVVWVEEAVIAGPINGSKVALRGFSVRPAASTQVGWELQFPFATVYPPGDFDFTDHPSIAAENFTAGPGYTMALAVWSYAYDLLGNLVSSTLNRFYYVNGIAGAPTSSSLGGSGKEIASSTDVAADDAGGFMVVWSYRPHKLLRGTTGTIAVSTLADISLNAFGENVQVGSKFHYLVSPGFAAVLQGLSGVVTSVAGPTVVLKSEFGASFPADGPTITWALTPPSKINGCRVTFSPFMEVDVVIVEPTAFSAVYQLEMREADYVRISRGSMNWCVVFQGFNSNAYPSTLLVRNYDNDFTLSGPTGPFGITLNDPQVYREHVSTCAVVLRDDGEVIYPTTKSFVALEGTGPRADSTSPQFDGRVARDLEVSLKSLGTRTPITERPNFQTLFTGFRFPVNEAREVSFLNFAYRWTSAGLQAAIPDVSWTGQDWVIVSPAKPVIHSFTGVLRFTGVGDSWLTDGLFYFGEDGGATDNGLWFLRKTLPAGSYIYFPVNGESWPITNVADEHSVNITGRPTGIADGTANVEWILMMPATPEAAGAKNQGFRIGSDGRIITSTDFITWADSPDDLSTTPREVELMRRPQGRGGNYPAIVAGELAGESADRLQAGSRYKADIGFRGVAPGRPKGISRYALNESGVVALAWGENLYGIFDRISEGATSFAAAMEFYRQTFGPYNITVKNLSVEATPSTTLQMLSQAHVFTRHSAPVASQVSFDTDGFRNVYVYAQSRVFAPYGGTPWFGVLPQFTSSIGVTYTNAKGQHPIYMDGPGLGRSDLSQWCSDPAWEDLAAGGYTLPGDQNRYIAPGTGPKVVWDGQRFVLFWVERANRKFAAPLKTDAASGYFLCMSYMPGSEDGNLQTTEMINPFEITGNVFQFPLASVHISDGTGFAGGLAAINEYNTVAVCDAAFSGKVYAVVWSVGLAPDNNDPTKTQGSTLGVTMFNMDSATAAYVLGTLGAYPGANQSGGGTSYVIEQSAESAAFQNPKILWDGNRFVVVYEAVALVSTASPPALASAVAYAVIPEDGLARPTAIKKIANRDLLIGTDYPTAYPGGPVFSAQPTAATLGAPVKSAVFDPGPPYYGAYYTVFQTFGARITPNFVARTTGATEGTAGSTLTDSAAPSFITSGVRPGDYLFIDTGVNVGTYLIKSITASTLVCETTWSGVFAVDVAVTYHVTRFQQPNVQPGDVLTVSRIRNVLTSVDSFTSNGVYPVINYDPKHHLMTVQGRFDAADIDGRCNIFTYGEIRSGGLSEYDNASNIEPTRAGVNPRSALVQNSGWATGATSPFIRRLHGVAYNDVDDEFALLVQHFEAPGRTSVCAFKPNLRATTPEVFLDSVADGHISRGGGDIAWNGSSYLVVAPILAGSVVQLQARLLNSRFAQLATAILQENTSDRSAGSFWFGNTAGQIPGPGYGAFPPFTLSSGKTAGTVYPWVSQMKVKWNARMSRWVVSASVLWYDQTAVPPNVYSDDGTFGPAQLIGLWPAGSRTITLGSQTQAWQPGMKVALFNGGFIRAVLTILDLSNSGVPVTGYDQIVVDAVPGDLLPALVGPILVAPIVREDVVTWTVGQDSTGLIIEDADNVHIEDVTVGGGATDISESWPNTGRPIWQAAGQTWGAPTNVTFVGPTAQASLTRQPQYNHRLLTPAGKVNLPMYTNVTSSGSHPYGRKPQPGGSYTRDNLRYRMRG